MVDAIARMTHDGETLTLGELTDLLELAPPDAPVEFRGSGLDGCTPSGFCSWRGIYADLALKPDANHARTVGDLLSMCREADGATYEGYKGGQYEMDRYTPVWVDEYGDWTPDRGLKAVRPLLRDGAVVKVLLVVESWAVEDE